MLAEIQDCTEIILSSGKIPFMIGGEHLVTLGSVRAAAEKYPDLHIIHFDAHADLREDYLGVQYSHACVLRRCWELLGDDRIYQFGIRSGDREEFRWAREGHVKMHKFNLDGLAEVIEKLQENRYTSHWIWMCWIRLYFREQELRRRAVSHLWN